MPTVFTHAFTGAALGAATMPPALRRRAIAAGVVCSLLPDADVLGLRFGIAYGDFLGHRGFTHSLPFAALLALLVTTAWFRGVGSFGQKLAVGAVLFAATASHGVMDAMTDGGRGVAFFSPFDTGRHFLPLRILPVSPLGVAALFDGRLLPILAREVLWVWLPCAVLSIASGAFLRRRVWSSFET